ncbi:MAG TPA: arginine repressor [Thermoanaerobaculia bacterium]|jgi:transcriptional regulator of arginine metabolism|nr:arginine repressor [Thermoanaerobaculia bacterium]
MPSDIDLRDQRRQAIVQLLREVSPASQGEIGDLLKERGFAATQSSISRDLRDLGVWRRGGRYVLPADAAADDEAAELEEVAVFLRGAQAAGPHLIVVRTVVGAAQTVAVAIDGAGWEEAVGTIAGDDTIFIATADPAGQAATLRRLEQLLQER